MLNLKFSKRAARFLEKCSDDLYKRIQKTIKDLQNNPFPRGFKKVEGREGVFRIREGYHRIIYAIIKENNDLFIVDIDKRSRIYD